MTTLVSDGQQKSGASAQTERRKNNSQEKPLNGMPQEGWCQLKQLSRTSVVDTFSRRQHSNDFIFARASYFRNRVLIIGLILLILSPLWAVFDFLVLPPEGRSVVITARIFLFLGLLATVVLAYRGRQQPQAIHFATASLLLLPIIFYLAVVLATPLENPLALLGYDFIPYMLTAMLAIFPLTLLEGLLLGLIFWLSELFALSFGGVVLSASGLQALWLLAAILCITLTASYFHLGLLLRLYREATHDALTGLLNRRAFMEASQRAFVSSKQSVAVLMLDLDHFKRLNDTHGHSVGDTVLQEFAKLLRQHSRLTDTAARYGGEEFAMVLLDVSLDDALAIAERIRLATEQMVVHDHEGQAVRVTVSIGATLLRSNETFSQGLRRADEGLYEAKKRSRNCVVGV